MGDVSIAFRDTENEMDECLPPRPSRKKVTFAGAWESTGITLRVLDHHPVEVSKITGFDFLFLV